MITEFDVKGIHCASCIKIIQMNVEELKGVASVSGEEKTGKVKVKYDKKVTNTKEIKEKIEQDGYKVLKMENRKN
ncbi:MAG: cation transporter [archaeon]|jgi:Cu+-exporting ATPase